MSSSRRVPVTRRTNPSCCFRCDLLEEAENVLDKTEKSRGNSPFYALLSVGFLLAETEKSPEYFLRTLSAQEEYPYVQPGVRASTGRLPRDVCVNHRCQSEELCF